ncbi:MAG: MMPL family transporter [Alphaproteobacteria bacterium]|nr:MMPL family transporter [Alphaproteobacteria bacterium]
MNFTDIFVRRPVLASVVSLLILVLGLRAAASLPILQYPQTQNAVVTVSAVYSGADANVIAGFIVTPLENAIAQANGIDYMTSTSRSGVGTIQVNLRLNYDVDAALTEINAKVNSVLNQLPPGSQQPVLSVAVGQSVDAMYIGFRSKVLAVNQVTDYLIRVVQPKLQSIQGVQTAEILGAQRFALRAWLDPKRLAAYGLTAADVRQALNDNNFISAIGTTKGRLVQVDLKASTDATSLEDFKELVIKQVNGGIVRLKDVATVTLGAESYESLSAYDGVTGVFIGIKAAPTANLLDVTARVRAAFPGIQAQLPAGLESNINYDSTEFVNASIHEVETTLALALGIVVLVVFAFLGSLRSVVIPTVAIPLSLIGTFTIMLIFGFSINLLTLLAMVLAIGLVVDDAIIVVENVDRHLKEGKTPFEAAIQGARELGGPIIAMTVVLVAVYVPIGFQAGLTGALFTEFAFTLAGAVTVSAIIALTLSPMMTSRLLRPHREQGQGWQERFTDFVDHRFDQLRGWYRRALSESLNTISVTVVFAIIVLGSIYFLYTSARHELAPQEDQGFIIASATPPPDATLEQRVGYAQQVYNIFSGFPEMQHVFQINAPGVSISGLVLKPWDERSRSTNALQQPLQQKLNQIAGARVVVFQPPSLPGAFGLPIQFVITTSEPFERLSEVSQAFLSEANKSGMFMFLDTDLKYDAPQSTIEIDRNKAAQLGLTMAQVGSALSSMLGGGYVNYFNFAGRSYQVIPQVEQAQRLNDDQLLSYYIKPANGPAVPLSTIAHITTRTVPESLNRFQQNNAAIIQGVMMPGVAQGDALAYLQGLAARLLPQGYTVDTAGPLRQFVQESGGFAVTFGFALIIIFLALAALFESFRDPVVILLSVPMSIAGALIFISLGVGGATVNIYTEVGLVTLMGLISKHGILIVEFANELQKQGRAKRQAIEEAAAIRLRPILMTTAAMVLGVVPLLTASGAGAVSRFDMGLVISTGIAIGTLFTLFVVPAAYLLIGSTHHKEVAAPAGETLAELEVHRT